ncbi:MULTISPECIES: hypothetical protein [Bacillus]|nr:MULTISPECIES: hypothetical protein [Bacillus]EOP17917.1 hypothetical protein IIS_04906 [Bacillus cereus VD131]MBJ8044098.1 hypothetical protein [Bacillus cereus group sp. N17]MBJ8067721.1 hypothetical protein [Bacillus cereus group sp. N15]MCS3600415.1 putative outer membrane lipoprotein [Bacillus sp. JUb91]HDR7449159.1 hypothetical protein [Bacillus toyonensis]
MQKIFLANLVAFSILTSMSFEHNEVVMNSKEETEEVDLMSIFPFEY